MKQASSLDAIDARWMRCAIALSNKAQGLTSENPNVGCVIIDADGNLCASGYTQAGGRPHAEQVALEKAGTNANQATLYVTLEPCSHFGKTPPCARAIIEAGIKRVVVGIIDPDTRVNGQGIEQLRQAGIHVQINVLGRDVADAMPSFLARKKLMLDGQEPDLNAMPHITVKIAHSRDGFVSNARGKGGQISNQVSSAYVHDLRSRVDAVLISQKTALVDNPRLTARIEGFKHPTTRIVLDRDFELLEKSLLVQTSDTHPLIIVCQNKPDPTHWVYERQKKYNIQLVIMNNNFKLVPIFNALLQQGQGHLLVEAGPRLLESLLSARLANEFIQIISPQKMEVGLSIVNTEQSVVFSPPPPYVLSKQFNLAKDSVKIWKR